MKARSAFLYVQHTSCPVSHNDMRNEITNLVSKGYTLEQIAERFTAVGVPVTPAALRRYRKGRKARSKRSPTVPQTAEKNREK